MGGPRNPAGGRGGEPRIRRIKRRKTAKFGAAGFCGIPEFGEQDPQNFWGVQGGDPEIWGGERETGEPKNGEGTLKFGGGDQRGSSPQYWGEREETPKFGGETLKLGGRLKMAGTPKFGREKGGDPKIWGGGSPKTTRSRCLEPFIGEKGQRPRPLPATPTQATPTPEFPRKCQK